jgi:hypothetical protein
MHTLYVKLGIGCTGHNEYIIWKCNSDIHQKNTLCTLKYTFFMNTAITGVYLSSVAFSFKGKI